MTANPTPASWQKSSHSGPDDGNNCIELGSTAQSLHLRESDIPDAVLSVGAIPLAHLLASLRCGASPRSHAKRTEPVPCPDPQTVEGAVSHT
ncbi:DUF397 domain-containing protein [Streptomyces sp. NPDC058417]|uniref:DUF397 domain-containing protein n=1 Tax=unclassified Streptomyces TaxID=2593676 RepID=UPI00365D5A06